MPDATHDRGNYEKQRTCTSRPRTQLAVMPTVRVGCSGWSYADWRGTIYPAGLPQRLWFDHYQELFDTVELNSTFYRLPSQTTADAWGAAAHQNFLFAVKLGQFGSHRMKLSDAASWLPNHLDRVCRLGDHLGPTLVQLPPRWKRNAERLDEFLHTARELAPPATRWAVEMRERSWLHDTIFEVLQRHGAALCVHDLLADHPYELTTDWTYVRFHGPNALTHPYHGSYGTHRLEAWADTLRTTMEGGNDVYAYFNNDWFGHAVRDAQYMRGALVGGAVDGATT